jgi:hypothetical protein
MAVDIFTHELSYADSSNMRFSLDGTPVSPMNVALDLVGGTAQAINGDFGVKGNQIVWDNSSYALNAWLSTYDVVRVIYDRS